MFEVKKFASTIQTYTTHNLTVYLKGHAEIFIEETESFGNLMTKDIIFYAIYLNIFRKRSQNKKIRYKQQGMHTKEDTAKIKQTNSILYVYMNIGYH